MWSKLNEMSKVVEGKTELSRKTRKEKSKRRGEERKKDKKREKKLN